ncbi:MULTISPECIES: LacI family DNA-binding transcriptional regulator [Streptomyces]|uniref:LacI family DNA-binding transcriptional regulator n=1 Tax=Streptomyces caniscabiei TaxID=2746961 RepID=A0ABU4MSN0_9ACTN|nr:MULTISPECIES: LacI family DNA-binding transcriptional regulator [Streptomyces]MBE4737384.1 LacI family DNA-binding transcriptional regulator [Streptomyces caniscabiei]MBE4756144.1 LacI family DNA-binding transcriptional regulator [Streptomyces caniscabiei]MBE4769839.1 LacI family DNA-binding transcriptional regulator [Streptomyces caniscabiei]MBE4787215.1 LacI family DNA-binding transcriptional regulator [Streptomyces caniscabiei]MBE4795380.1 LacI family DNA-binding transcriptional regulato
MAGTSRGRRVTSGDVAKEAGVSRATVSYVLNDSPHQKIAEATRKRVWEAAARLGYAPSAAARALRTGRSDIVLGVLPDWPIHHVLGRLIQQLTNAFAEHELTFLVHSSAQPARPLREVWKALTPAAVLALNEFPESEAEAMRAVGIEVVMAMHGTPSQDLHPPLVSEQPIGALQARHLAASHRRLGYAYPDLPRLDVLAQPRLAGVRQVCEEHGLPEPVVRAVPLELDGAAEAVKAWLAADPPVTGICAFNDDIAMAVLLGAQSLGLDVPGDLAVIGVDDIPSSALLRPSLTTVVRDTDTLARGLAHRVVEALDRKETLTTRIEDPLSIEQRDST